MGKLQDVLNRLLRSAEAETEKDEDQEQQEQTPEAGSDTTTEEVTTEDETAEEPEVLEQVTLALELIGQQMETAIKAIQLLDQNIKAHDQIIRGLAKSETERLQSAVQGGEWYKALFVASRDADPVPEDKQGDLQKKMIQQAPVGESGSILDPIMFGKE